MAEIARAILHILAEHDGVCPGLTHRDGFECRHNDFVPRYVAAPGTTPDVSEARRNTEPARKSSLTGSELLSAQSVKGDAAKQNPRLLRLLTMLDFPREAGATLS